MKINKFFYLLFCADIAVGIALWLLIDLSVGVITASVLLFINFTTFAVIIKIQKVQKNLYGTKKQIQ